MKTWRVSNGAAACGNCGSAVVAGGAFLELSRPGWAVKRCESCAGESAPDSLEASDVATRLLSFGPRVEAIAEKWRKAGRDFKVAQGERE